MVYTNAYPRTLDAKHRLQLPSEFRRNGEKDEVGAGKDAFFAVPGKRSHTVVLVPEQQFDAEAERLFAEVGDVDDAEDAEELYYSLACRLEPDGQGRLLMPDRLLKLVELGSDVTLAGWNDRIVIWRTADYDQFVAYNYAQRWSKLQKYVRRNGRGRGGELSGEQGS